MFLETEEVVESWTSNEARDVFLKYLAKIDEDWSTLVRLSTVVMSIMVFAARRSNRDIAREVSSGTLGLLGMMCDSWAYALGNVVVNAPEDHQIIKEASVVDLSGQKLRDGANSFFTTVMIHMFFPLMSQWHNFFVLVASIKDKTSQAMNQSDADAILNSCSEELRLAFRKMEQEVTKIVSGGSCESVVTMGWIKGARPKFYSILKYLGGGSEHQAMASVIQECNLPKISI